MSRKNSVVCLSPRTTRATINEEAARFNRRTRLKRFWRWATNKRPLVAAFTLTMLILMLNQGSALLNGGNGVPFCLAMIGFGGTFFGAWQFWTAEPGYSMSDFLLGIQKSGRYGW